MSTEKMRNVGPKGMAWLRQTGVRSLQDLRDVGALSAYVRVRRAGFKPSLNLLYALEGAILDCHWQQIPDERRAELVGQAEAAVALLPQPKGRRMPVAGPVTTTRNDDEPAGLPPSDGFESADGAHGFDGDDRDDRDDRSAADAGDAGEDA